MQGGYAVPALFMACQKYIGVHAVLAGGMENWVGLYRAECTSLQLWDPRCCNTPPEAEESKDRVSMMMLMMNMVVG